MNDQKHVRKRPWLDSAVYLSIIYLEYLRISPEIEYIVLMSPKGGAPKAALD